MQQSLSDSADTLKSYGLSTETIARMAYIKRSVLRAMIRDIIPISDPTFTHLSNAVSLLDALDNITTLSVEAAAFYEEQIVIMKKNGESFYCPAYYLYESGLWTRKEFIDYANSATFYSRRDFAEEFPLETKVVDASDGYKAIVCKYPIARLGSTPPSSLSEFTVIK